MGDTDTGAAASGGTAGSKSTLRGTMKRHSSKLLLVVGAAACVVIGATAGAARGPDRTPPAQGSATGEPGDVIARVNGAPITEMDLLLRLENDSHEAIRSEDRRKTVLEDLIRRELLAQKARAEGLDKDPTLEEVRRRRAAQLAAAERQELSDLVLARAGERRGAPTEASARAYFAKHEERIRTSVHVHMILRRSEAAIMEARNAIDGGRPFEEVAASLLPGLQEGKKPWDLGYLSFSKVPEAWRDTVYELSPGARSEILRGPNERFWLVKVVDVRRDANVTFEDARAAIEAEMLQHRTQIARDELDRELREAARVEIVKPIR